MLKKEFINYSSFLLLLLIAVNATGLFSDILEPDGILYANIAKRIALTNNWMNLYVDGTDWLDKPHLPFWITALSFKLFGISAFTYKLPAFICWLSGLYFLFRMASFIYNREIAWVTLIIYASALHILLSNFDVRAEPYLTAFVICAIYFLIRMFTSNSIKWLVFAALATAAAIMTKGIFILVTIGGGFLFYLISIKGLRQLLHYRWLLFILLVLIFITPELYSLYTQFDLHPEKVVFGTTSVSGIRFFLWDSQFGRFFNTGPIKGSGDLMFFFHTTLWAFLPWSLLLMAAVWNLARRPVSNKLATIISGSALLSFIMFSLSRFQLPHYLVILFPHFSLITGRYINGLKNIKTIRIWNWIQSTILVILPIIILSLYIYSGLVSSVMAWLPGTAIIVLTLLIFRKNVTTDILIKGVIFTTVLFYFMNLFFYPSLLKYQSGMVAAKAINKIAPAEQPFLYMNNSWTFQFYCMKPPIQINNDSLKNYKFESVNAFVRQQDLAYLDSSVYKYSVIQQFDHFHVSILNREFLNKETREKNLNKAMLIKIYTR